MTLQVHTGPRRTIGKYEVLGRLGAGGMAEVFLCRARYEEDVERLVAVKRTLPQLSDDTMFLTMFIDEARISAGLTHDNIAQVLDFGRHGSAYFIAMAYVQGVDMRAVHAYFNEQRRLPPWAMAAHVVGKICAALDYAHNKRDHQGKPLNIIHRDVSPANVLVSFEGQIKLIDFGIARAAQRLFQTVGPALKGKVAYMSPEQAAGAEMDHRTDIYGAGIMLFELLTGRNPFRARGESDMECLVRVREGKVPSPRSIVEDLPPALERICQKAVEREPRQRYDSAGQMQEDLEAFCHGVGYGFRKFQLWVKEAFAERIEASQRLLREAWALARQPTFETAGNGADTPTVIEESDPGGAALQELPTEIAPGEASTAAVPEPETGAGSAHPPVADVATEADHDAEARSAAADTIKDDTFDKLPAAMERAAEAALPQVVERPARPRGRALPLTWIVAGAAGLAGLAAMSVWLLIGKAETPPAEAPPAPATVVAAPAPAPAPDASGTTTTTAGPEPTPPPVAKPGKAEPEVRTITVDTGTPAARCMARVGARALPAQTGRCRFTVPSGQRLSLRVVLAGEERYEESWEVRSDRSIRLKLKPRAAAAPASGLRPPPKAHEKGRASENVDW